MWLIISNEPYLISYFRALSLIIAKNSLTCPLQTNWSQAISSASHTVLCLTWYRQHHRINLRAPKTNHFERWMLLLSNLILDEPEFVSKATKTKTERRTRKMKCISLKWDINTFSNIIVFVSLGFPRGIQGALQIRLHMLSETLVACFPSNDCLWPAVARQCRSQ